MTRLDFDLLIVGAGPAGLAAARTAARAATRVAVIDENPAAGGQVWRSGVGGDSVPQSRQWLRARHESNVSRIYSATVIGATDPRTLLVERDGALLEVHGERIVLACGARERFLPFPGWTLPGVTGAGGLQALVKGGLPIKDKRVAVAGTGPLLLATAEYLTDHGAHVVMIVEQASWQNLAAFGVRLPLFPSKLVQAAGLGRKLRGVPYKARAWVVRASGADRLQSVVFRTGATSITTECDYLACGFDLVPNIELPALLGCRYSTVGVGVDQWQESSVPGVYCAGEVTGIGGLEVSLIEGQLAGFAATGRKAPAATLFKRRKAAQRFAVAMQRAFSLREELRSLAEPETVVCRCEDVTYGRLAKYAAWKDAKLQERCGMGACQGRICGPATEFLFGWNPESVRPPIAPVPIGVLAHLQPGAGHLLR